MESTIYQQSPLAEYLEGQGEGSQDWQITEGALEAESVETPSFAPSGPPKPTQSRVQQLLSPLRTQGHRRTKTLTALQDVCSAAISVRVSTSENDLFLDRFRYLIIASQLLVAEAKPSAETYFSDPLGESMTPDHHAGNPIRLQGAAITVIISFSVAWVLHWAKLRSPGPVLSWLNVYVSFLLLALLVIGTHGYAGRKASQRVRQAAVGALSEIITQSHALDKVARSALGLIQEVEIVCRGYEISNPLPPISRLESEGADRRCLVLRSGLANAISSTTHCYLEAHNVLLPFVDRVDMQRYHDIYELSRQAYQEMIQGLPLTSKHDPESLKGLKASLGQLFIARQILLCDLLALPSDLSIHDSSRWSVISDEMLNVSSVAGTSATAIGRLISEEINRPWGGPLAAHALGSAQFDGCQASEVVAPKTPGKDRAQAQLRRLDALSQSIRSLNARMSLMRDEANSLIDDARQSSDISCFLAKQYDHIGSDLRNLLLEWERGRNTMLLGMGALDRMSISRSSSGVRSSHSPVHSLGGTTAVNEGSPAEALKRLTGEGSEAPSNGSLGSDEEVFEAVSLPPKPKVLSLSRAEKLAKMQEERRKRATLQENKDATTNMLRELETVIKHRPRGRTTSRITSL